MLKLTIKKLLKDFLFHTPIRKNFFPIYDYNFTPPQLCFLCQCLEDARHVTGSIAEIGCAGGSTTVFLNKYLSAQNIEKTYYAVDTFSGFVSRDIEFEVSNRGKSPGMFTSFRVNKKKWFDGTMQQNHISRVSSIEANVNDYDLKTLGPISFALLDVDLYLPMKKCLKELYEVLTPSGMIIVDDCNPNDIRWDGSDQAYKEFMKEINQPPQVVHGKLGVIKKPT